MFNSCSVITKIFLNCQDKETHITSTVTDQTNHVIKEKYDPTLKVTDINFI